MGTGGRARADGGGPLSVLGRLCGGGGDAAERSLELELTRRFGGGGALYTTDARGEVGFVGDVGTYTELRGDVGFVGDVGT